MASDDVQLLRDCLDGRPGAWEAFVERFAPYLAEVCRRALARYGLPSGNPDVEDMLQELFLTLWESDLRVLRAYRGQSGVPAYLAAVAVHRISKKGRGILLPPASPEAEPAAPEDPLETREALELLKVELDKLPLQARLALTLQSEGAGLREIARALGVTRDAAAHLVSRARAGLRGRLKKNP